MDGIRWLASQGMSLPKSVERVIVMDASDLAILPMSNEHPNAFGADVDRLWKDAGGDKPLRILLRRGVNDEAAAAAKGAAAAAAFSSAAAMAAVEAAETGDAEKAAEAARLHSEAASTSASVALAQMSNVMANKSHLVDAGVGVETLTASDPIDVMTYLGEKNGYRLAVWRAGCWRDRSVASIEAGAFQSIAAHMAVGASGGKFWQTLTAEKAVQAACGSTQSRIEIRSEGVVSLEFCNEEDEDESCMVTTKDPATGEAVRQVRIACDINLVNGDDAGLMANSFVSNKSTRPSSEEMGAYMPRLGKKVEAPWFL